MSEKIKVKDCIWARVEYRDGRIEIHRTKGKTLTNDGLDLVVKRVISAVVSFIGYGAVGTGTSTPQTTDTELETEIFRTAISVATNPSTGKGHLEFVIGYTDANGETITEAGVFNDSEAGIMLLRKLFDPAFDKTSDKKITVIVEFTAEIA